MSFFEYRNLRKFLHTLKDTAEVLRLIDWWGENGIVLRHDVDFDIKPAYLLSLLEMDQNIRSSFFIMVTNSNYNPMTQANREMLREMVSNGFEIGLHFDPWCYGDLSDAQLQRKMETEMSILENILSPTEVKSVSLHRPHQRFIEFSGFKSAYFPTESYLSDAHMIFETPPLEFIKKAEHSAVEITLHPFHYTEDGDDYLEIIRKFITEKTNMIDYEFRNFEAFKKGKGNEKLERILLR